MASSAKVIPLPHGLDTVRTPLLEKLPTTAEPISRSGGTPILTAADGTVTIANAIDTWGGGYGYYIKINHNDTFDTLYAHCSSICVTVGQEVKQGEVIGYVGTTGNSTGNHLHFEVWQNGERTDALGYLKRKNKNAILFITSIALFLLSYRNCDRM